MLDILCLMSIITYTTGNTAVNLALRKPTTMSSLFRECRSSYAVDGNTGTHVINDGCAHTALDDSTPYWMVDLRGTFLVDQVSILGRSDMYWECLNSFVIEIFETNPLHCLSAIPRVCWNYTGPPFEQAENKTFTCNTPVRGRFVRVRKWKFNDFHDVLNLCEVQIFGNNPTECSPVSMARVEGKRLKSGHVMVIPNLTSMECAVQCHRKRACLAFNFNNNKRDCEMLDNTVFEDTTESDPAWSYYGPDLC